MTRQHLVYLWGDGGYYVLQRSRDGSLSVPSGRKAWEAFAHYAPRPLLLAVLETLQEGVRS